MTLEQIRPGASARIVAIDGGHGVQGRLRQMGIHPGDTVLVRSSGAFRGPLLVDVHGCRVAVGRGIARRITVEPVARGAGSEGRR